MATPIAVPAYAENGPEDNHESSVVNKNEPLSPSQPQSQSQPQSHPQPQPSVTEKKLTEQTSTHSPKMQWQWLRRHKHLKFNEDHSVVRRTTALPLQCSGVIGTQPLHVGDSFSVTIESWRYFSCEGCSIGVISHTGDVELEGGYAQAGRDPRSIGLFMEPQGLMFDETSAIAALFVANPASSTKKPLSPTQHGPTVSGLRQHDDVHVKVMGGQSGVVLRVTLGDGVYSQDIAVPPSFSLPFLPYATVAPGLALKITGRTIRR